MVMLRPPGKAEKVAKKVLGKEGVKVPKSKSMIKKPLQTPYMQH